MCEQCQGFNDEDEADALAAAFVQRQLRAQVKPAPTALDSVKQGARIPLSGRNRNDTVPATGKIPSR